MDDDQLFLETLCDLEERIASKNEYKVLKSSGLLRLLLLDQRRLVDAVNQSYGLNLRFRISKESSFEKQMHQDDAVFWSLEDLLDGESSLAFEPFDATRDQFLSRKIMRLGPQSITVRDVIDHLANVEGGVHIGKANNDRRRAAEAIGRFYSRAGLPGVVNQVKLIGRITVRALNPLREAVLAARTST